VVLLAASVPFMMLILFAVGLFFVSARPALWRNRLLGDGARTWSPHLRRKLAEARAEAAAPRKIGSAFVEG